MMPIYVYADLTLSSTLTLAELPISRGREAQPPDLAIGELAFSPKSSDNECIHCWQLHGSIPSVYLDKTNQGFILRCADVAYFSISADGSRIGVWPAPSASEETLRHLLLDQVLPRLFAHRGRVVLHAGAVRVDGRAIAFLGDTGSGKSTLAASFHGVGFPLLSDDGLVLSHAEGLTSALPTYPSLRLWPDSVSRLYKKRPPLEPMAHYSSKQRVAVGKANDSVSNLMPLAAIYLLAPTAETGSQKISISRLSPRDACVAMIGNSFQLDVTDISRAAGLLTTAAQVARTVPAFRLGYPRDFDLLPSVRAAILRTISVLAEDPCSSP